MSDMDEEAPTASEGPSDTPGGLGIRSCDKPMYRRVLERVEVTDRVHVMKKHQKRFSVSLSFDAGLGAVFEFDEEEDATRCWRQLVGLER